MSRPGTPRGQSLSRTPRYQAKKPCAAKPKEKKSAYNIPAFSLGKGLLGGTEAEVLAKLRQKTIRRHAPPGEDLKAMKNLIKELKGKTITVQEFIGLVSPYTGDNGAVLRDIMAEDINMFRNLITKIYDTITQDTSDVLINQQLQLCEYYKDKDRMLRHKMMKAVSEILEMFPAFDFERYNKEKKKYLDVIFPVPAELQMDPEELEMHRRQQTYHRLQWLRTEGERMNEENVKLQNRLSALKREYKDEQNKVANYEDFVEEQREQLEACEAKQIDRLEQLSESIEKNIIIEEANINNEAKKSTLKTIRQKPTRTKLSASKLDKMKRAKLDWSQEAAADIDKQTIDDSQQAEVQATLSYLGAPQSGGGKSGASRSGTSKTRIQRPKRPQARRADSRTSTEKQPPRERSPFHFSPIKSPPKQQQPKERSPFHYSPIKSPPRQQQSQQRSPFHYSPPREPPGAPSVVETTTQSVTTSRTQPRGSPQQQQRQQQQQQERGSYGRMGASRPRDQWKGFQ